jgi:hypothetical protein
MSVTDDATLLCWTDGVLAPAPDAAGSGPLLAADSWLVVDGAARAADAHWARFGAACRADGVEIDGFRAAVAAALPASGRWFPRVELGARAPGARAGAGTAARDGRAARRSALAAWPQGP